MPQPTHELKASIKARISNRVGCLSIPCTAWPTIVPWPIVGPIWFQDVQVTRQIGTNEGFPSYITNASIWGHKKTAFLTIKQMQWLDGHAV